MFDYNWHNICFIIFYSRINERTVQELLREKKPCSRETIASSLPPHWGVKNVREVGRDPLQKAWHMGANMDQNFWGIPVDSAITRRALVLGLITMAVTDQVRMVSAFISLIRCASLKGNRNM